MKGKHIIIFICALVITTACLIVLLNKETIFEKKKEEKNEEIKIPEQEKFTYTPVMYKICDDDNCNYLLGSMHLGDNRITSLSDKVLNAYKEMDSIAVEIDASAGINLESLMLPTGVTIDDLISEELNQKLIDFGSKHMLFPYEQYKNYKLGMISDLLATTIYMELGYLNEGVDSYFIKLANKDNKDVISFETVESQLSFFTDYSDELYSFLIETTVDNYEEEKELARKLYNAYLEGNANKISDVLKAEEMDDSDILDKKILDEYKEYNYNIYDKRNIVMSSAIEDFLAQNKNVFVTVGAAHVIGDGGIIEILTNKGYKITSMN